MSDIGKRAIEYHQSGFNCGQSVFLCFAEEDGFGFDQAAALTNCLGGGFSQTGGICGAVSAACLAVSAKFGRFEPSREGESLGRQEKTYRLVQRLQADFAEEFGAVGCPELLERGLEASGDIGNDKFLCPRYVERAAELAAAARQEE